MTHFIKHVYGNVDYYVFFIWLLRKSWNEEETNEQFLDFVFFGGLVSHNRKKKKINQLSQ